MAGILSAAGTPVHRYSVGDRQYGANGTQRGPNVGPVSGAGRNGYNDRDARMRARQQAITDRLKQGPRRVM